MAKKELDAILEAEKAAAEAIENAKAKAKEMLTASEKEAERILRDALDSAQSEAKALSLEASETYPASKKRSQRSPRRGLTPNRYSQQEI